MTRVERFRAMARECRDLAADWPDPDVRTSFANAASELETVADAMLKRGRGR